MKKTIALILTLVLVLALCACGGGKAQDIVNNAANGNETVGEKPAAEPAEEPAKEPAEEPDEDDLPRGAITETENGTHYENSYLGFACDLDENWYVYSEEEMAQMAGITAEQFEGTDYEELLKNTSVFYDFFAARTDGMATINVNYSYTGPMVQALDMDSYLEAMIPQLKSVLEAGGMSDVSIEKSSVTFCGSERTGLLIRAKTQGVDYYAQQIYTVVGPRISTLTLGTFLEDNTADLVALFQPIG